MDPVLQNNSSIHQKQIILIVNKIHKAKFYIEPPYQCKNSHKCAIYSQVNHGSYTHDLLDFRQIFKRGLIPLINICMILFFGA